MQQVRIRFNVEGALELPDDAVQIQSNVRSLTVRITDQRGIQRSLVVPKLYGSIRSATVKRTNAQVTVILKKASSVVWDRLRAAKKKGNGLKRLKAP